MSFKGIGFKFDKVKSIDVNSVGIIKTGADLVAEAIHRILNTRPYERPMENFGCRIKEVMFEPNDYITATLGGYFVSDAIGRYEKRASIVQVIATPVQNSNQLKITILFRLKSNPVQLFSTTVLS